MTLEEIVRALAKHEAPLDGEYGYCHLCESRSYETNYWETDGHDAKCPWRLAREWVEAHPE